MHSGHSPSWGQISFISFNVQCGAPISHPLKMNWMHSLYIQLPALLFWFKLAYEPFGQSKMQPILDFCQEQPGRNQIKNRVECSPYMNSYSKLHA